MSETSAELVKAATAAEIKSRNMLTTKDSFELVQRVAKMYSESDLVPKNYKGKIGNCIIAIEMAHRIGASTLMVMQHLNIILGTPAWSSKFLIATLNNCGKFSPLRYEDNDKDGGSCRAWAVDKLNNEKVYGAWVSMKMAQAEGWIDKAGSKWKTMPELMRRYRAASFFTNQFAPEVSMGLQTQEEVFDVKAQENVYEDVVHVEVKDDKTEGTDVVREKTNLVKMDLDRNFTDSYTEVIELITSGMVTHIDQLKDKYNFTKEMEKELIELLTKK